jgi:hypothetical protein
MIACLSFARGAEEPAKAMNRTQGRIRGYGKQDQVHATFDNEPSRIHPCGTALAAEGDAVPAGPLPSLVAPVAFSTGREPMRTSLEIWIVQQPLIGCK